MKNILQRDRDLFLLVLIVAIAIVLFVVSFFDFAIPFWETIYDRLTQLFGLGSVALLIATTLPLFIIIAVPIFLLFSPLLFLRIIRQKKKQALQGDVMHFTIWIAVIIVIFSLLIVGYLINTITLGVFSPW